VAVIQVSDRELTRPLVMIDLADGRLTVEADEAAAASTTQPHLVAR